MFLSFFELVYTAWDGDQLVGLICAMAATMAGLWEFRKNGDGFCKFYGIFGAECSPNEGFNVFRDERFIINQREDS